MTSLNWDQPSLAKLPLLNSDLNIFAANRGSKHLHSSSPKIEYNPLQNLKKFLPNNFDFYHSLPQSIQKKIARPGLFSMGDFPIVSPHESRFGHSNSSYFENIPRPGFPSSSLNRLQQNHTGSTLPTSFYPQISVPDFLSSPLNDTWNLEKPDSYFSTYMQPASLSPQSKKSSPLVGKSSDGEYIFMDFEYITNLDPQIPLAIPAPYSYNDGRGTLDRILDNPHSTTNVYIRGFPPNTTDSMLTQYGARFGKIESAKSIIDHLTSTCKG